MSQIKKNAIIFHIVFYDFAIRKKVLKNISDSSKFFYFIRKIANLVLTKMNRQERYFIIKIIYHPCIYFVRKKSCAMKLKTCEGKQRQLDDDVITFCRKLIHSIIDFILPCKEIHLLRQRFIGICILVLASTIFSLRSQGLLKIS